MKMKKLAQPFILKYRDPHIFLDYMIHALLIAPFYLTRIQRGRKSEMRNKKTILIAAVVLFVLYKLLVRDIWDVNAGKLKDNVLSLDPNAVSVNLKDLTPFEWDTVYSFDPYTSKEQVYETVGYRWDKISDALSEGMNQIVFLNDGEVVCYVFGYPENNRFGISFSGEEDSNVPMLTINDPLDFTIRRSTTTVYLSTPH